MKQEQPRRDLAGKLHRAREWQWDLEKEAGEILERSKLPSFNPAEWDGLAYKIGICRKLLGRAQSHARRMARRGLERKGLR